MTQSRGWSRSNKCGVCSVTFGVWSVTFRECSVTFVGQLFPPVFVFIVLFAVCFLGSPENRASVWAVSLPLKRSNGVRLSFS